MFRPSIHYQAAHNCLYLQLQEVLTSLSTNTHMHIPPPHTHTIKLYFVLKRKKKKTDKEKRVLKRSKEINHSWGKFVLEGIRTIDFQILITLGQVRSHEFLLV